MVRLGPRSPSPSAAVPRPPTAATGGSATTPTRGPSGTNARSHSDRPRFQAPGASQRRSDRAYFSQSGPTGAAQVKAREPPPNPGRSILGERIAFDPAGPTADAEWTKHNLARVQASLPNGYCGRPPQQDCPHPNACLTCPDFQTTPEFLDIHRRQRDDTGTLIATADADGHSDGD